MRVVELGLRVAELERHEKISKECLAKCVEDGQCLGDMAKAQRLRAEGLERECEAMRKALRHERGESQWASECRTDAEVNVALQCDIDVLRARVAELEAAAKPRPMSEARNVAIGCLLRIRSHRLGWVVCRNIEHVGYIVATGDVDDVVRDGLGWLPLFPDESKDGPS